MIHFVPLTPQQRLLRALWPPYRRRRDQRIRHAIEALCDDPGLPCMVVGQCIPHGFGQLCGWRIW